MNLATFHVVVHASVVSFLKTKNLGTTSMMELEKHKCAFKLFCHGYGSANFGIHKGVSSFQGVNLHLF